MYHRELLPVPALVDAAERNHLDLCVGSRFLRDFGPGSRSTFTRRIGIRFFAWLMRPST